MSTLQLGCCLDSGAALLGLWAAAMGVTILVADIALVLVYAYLSEPAISVGHFLQADSIFQALSSTLPSS